MHGGRFRFLTDVLFRFEVTLVMGNGVVGFG